MGFTIKSALGSEYEFSNQVPPDINYEKIHGSNLYSIYGEWGRMIFQQIQGLGVSVWYSQYLLNCATEFIGYADQAVTEQHNSLEKYFACDWDGIGLPTEKEGEGGFSHNPYVVNKAYFPGADLYRTFDFHYDHDFLIPYANAYPMLYEMLNHAGRKKASRVDKTLILDGDMRVIINQIKRYSSRMPERYFQAKVDEFLIEALNRMHPEKRHQAIPLGDLMNKKAEQAEEIMQERYMEVLTLTGIAKEVGTNVQYIGTAFKQRYSITIFERLMAIRLENAKRLLIEKPQARLEAIAIETQLYDSSSLIKAFKKRYGVRPTEYRKAGRTKT
jgi:AraC-like DNA-binding protein